MQRETVKRKLEKSLLDQGFVKVNENLLVLKKDCGHTSLFIVERGARSHQNKKAIELGISINDRFVSEQTDGLALSVFLSETGVSSREDGLAIWWDFPSEEEKAVARILKDGFNWFANFSSTQNLIAYFERGLTLGVANRPAKGGLISSIAHKIVFRQNPIESKAIRHPPVYNYYLSILYYEIGNFEKSEKFALEWFDFTKTRKLENEPERTMKHLEALNVNLSRLSARQT